MNVQTAPERLRIDDLAQRAEMPSGTIRFYQREGLIPPPEREGRVAYYSDEHLRRLERIRVLQTQGLPLSVIGDLLAREDAGEDIAGWLALDSAVFARAAGEEPIEELAARLLEAGLSPAKIASGSEFVTERLTEVASKMAELGWEIFAFERERISADQPVAEDVLARLEQLRALAQRIVATVFRQQLDEAIRTRVEPFAEETAARRRGRGK